MREFDDFELIGMLKSYIRKCLAGVGALEGAPCEIQSITETSDGNIVTFKWEDKNGVSHTDTMEVKNGEDGEDGSVVTVTPILATGTKIAEIEVDGTTQNIYAPAGGGGSGDGRYNVLDYGLVGDGSTDNTTALRALITEAPNGSVIFFPVGTYLISDAITVNKSITFLGENEEMQSGAGAANRTDHPMSIITMKNTVADVTMFQKAQTGYNDINFVNLTFDGGGSYEVEDNGPNAGEWTGSKEPAQYTLATVKSGSDPHALGLYQYDDQTETYSLTQDETLVSGKDYYLHLPFHNQLATTVRAGVNGVDMGRLAPGIVKNCMFWGFSGFGLKTAQHKYIERCGFYKCKRGIVTTWSDSMLHDLWFCKSGTAIHMEPLAGDTLNFVSINLSDVWADQLIDHLVDADATVRSVQIITSNIWVDSIGKSAFYLPNMVLSKSHIQGTFGRVGMDYAGLPDACRTAELSVYTDFIACGRIQYSILELNISNVTVGKGWNATGECFSRLITVDQIQQSNSDNKVVCNAFASEKLFDINTMPLQAHFIDTEFNGTDGDVLFHTNIVKFVSGVYVWNNSPKGRMKAPAKGLFVYDYAARRWWRSTLAGDTQAWAEVTTPIPIVDMLPTAKASELNKMYTYIGDSSLAQQLTQGGTYKCISDGEGGYKWDLITITMETLKTALQYSTTFDEFKSMVLGN